MFQISDAESGGVLFNLQSNAIAVMKRSRGDHLNRHLQTEFSDALETFGEYLTFDFKLRRIANVLILASAAAGIVGTIGRDAVRTRFEQLNETATANPAPRRLGQHPGALAGYDAGNQQHPFGCAR